MDGGTSWQRGGALVVVSLAVMALYFLLSGPGWAALAMAVAALGVAVALPRRRSVPRRSRASGSGVVDAAP